MDITDPSAPTQPTAASSDASSSNPQPENEAADPPLPGQENEVQTYQDLHVLKEVVLGPDDVPKNLSDDESSVPDDDSDASSIASSAVAMEDADAALLAADDRASWAAAGRGDPAHARAGLHPSGHQAVQLLHRAAAGQ